ncbi:FixH family protein [Paenibacillus sp. MCAF20]
MSSDESIVTTRARTPLLKWSLALLAAAVIITAAFAWLQTTEAAPPAVTEHSFEEGSLTWEIGRYPAKVLDLNDFRLSLRNSEGAPLRNAELSIVLDMIGMNCGNYSFKLTETAPGVYEGEGMPLMAGTWKATLTLDTADGNYILARRLSAVH